MSFFISCRNLFFYPKYGSVQASSSQASVWHNSREEQNVATLTQFILSFFHAFYVPYSREVKRGCRFSFYPGLPYVIHTKLDTEIWCLENYNSCS